MLDLLTSSIHEVNDDTDLFEFCYSQGWTDGLPVVPPTPAKVTSFLKYASLEPDAVIGHSMGEVSAAVVAGVLSPAEGLRVIASRSRLMAQLVEKGAVALLELDAPGTEALIADYPGVTVAVYSSPRQTVVAGPTEAVCQSTTTSDGAPGSTPNSRLSGR